MFRPEPAVLSGLTNPLCTSSAKKWLPFRKFIKVTKFKDLKFKREDFAQRGRKKRILVGSPKIKFTQLAKSDKQSFSLIGFTLAIEEIATNRYLSLLLLSLKLSLFEKLLQKMLRRLIGNISNWIYK